MPLMHRSSSMHEPEPDARQEHSRPLGLGVLLLLAVPCALAQTAADPASTVLPSVVVTAARVEAAPFDVAASIDRVDGDAVRSDRAQVNISESLGGVPGLLYTSPSPRDGLLSRMPSSA